jgi:hypothetical protein
VVEQQWGGGLADQFGVRDVDPGDRLGHVLRPFTRISRYVQRARAAAVGPPRGRPYFTQIWPDSCRLGRTFVARCWCRSRPIPGAAARSALRALSAFEASVYVALEGPLTRAGIGGPGSGLECRSLPRTVVPGAGVPLGVPLW